GQATPVSAALAVAGPATPATIVTPEPPAPAVAAPAVPVAVASAEVLPANAAPGGRGGNVPGRGGRGLGGGRGRGPVIPPGIVLTAEARAAMKQETESYFAH